MTGLLDLSVLSGWLSDVLAKEIHDTFLSQRFGMSHSIFKLFFKVENHGK